MARNSQRGSYRWNGAVALGAGFWTLLAACGGNAGDRTGELAAADPAPLPADPSEEDGGGSPAAPGPMTTVTLPQPPSAAEVPGPPACGASGEVEGNFEAYTRADVEHLAGCAIIHGDLRIYATALDELAPLSSLRAVDGIFWLGDYVSAGTLVSVPLGSLHGLESLERVGSLFVSGVVLSTGALPLPALRGDVKQLVLANLPGVTDLQAFANVRASVELSVESMPDLTNLAGARVAPELENVSVWYSPRLVSLAGIDGLQRLRQLWLEETPALVRLDLPDGLAELSSAVLSGPNELTTLGELSRFGTIEGLSVSKAPRLADLGGASAPTGSLTSLIVQSCPSLDVIDPVGGLANLAQVSIIDCDGITEIDGLAASAALERLQISENDALARLPVFDRAGSSMSSVRIGQNASLVEGPEFPNLVTLYEFDAINYEKAELEIVDNPELRSIGFPRLESSSMVTISRNARVETVSLPSLRSLQRLRVTDNASLAHLALALQEDIAAVELTSHPLLSDVTFGAPTAPLRQLKLLENPVLPAEVRQLLLALVGPDTEVELD